MLRLSGPGSPRRNLFVPPTRDLASRRAMRELLGRISTGTILGFLLLAAHEPARLETLGEKVAGQPPPADGEMRLPPDLLFDKTVGADQAVTFRHSTHVMLADGNCVSCHPEPFRLLHPVRETSHDAMDKGGSCGTCHDGKKAFGTTDDKNCSTCHEGMGDKS